MNGSPPSSPPSSNCPCDIPQDPQVVGNPPGLASITDRVDDFTGFRRALLRPLPGEQALGLWSPAAGDLGLQFLEWWAYVADVLTFYNERIANNTYLRTAQFPDSIAGLVALLGYVPAPGLAATGQIGAIRTTTYPGEPLVIPAGMQLSSTATPGVPAQTFEAAEASFPGPSDVVATRPPDPDLRVTSSASSTNVGPASVLLAGKVTGTKAGDKLLLVAKDWAGNDNNWAAVTVEAVSPETDPGTGAVNTRVGFTSDAVWGSVQAPPATESSSQGAATAALLEATASSAMRVAESSPQLAGSSPPVTRSAVARVDLPAGLYSIGGGWWRGFQPQPSQPQNPQATDYRLIKPTAAASLSSQQGVDVSQAHTDIGSDNYVLPDSGSGQSNWRWCSKCQGLFFAGSPTLGVCPAGGTHTDVGSDNYVLPDSGSGQSNWRWCSKCQGLFFAGNPTLGACPAGGTHTDVGSDNYVLPDSGSGQSNWRWCSKCQGLFFAGNPTLGVCPAGGVNLSATVRSIQPGDLVFLDGGASLSMLGLVTGTADRLSEIPFPEKLSPPAPDLIAPYTALLVATPDSGSLSGADARTIAVRYGFRDVGTVLPNPQGTLPTLTPLATVLVRAGFKLPAGISTALLEDSTGAGTVVQVAPTQNPDPTSDAVALALSPDPPAAATFDPPLQVPLRLLFDIVTVSRGTTVTNEVLGSGNAALANQSFTLQKSPLTYLASGTGWTAALAVYVDNIQWSEVPTLYNQPANAQVYVVERSPDQSVTTVRFGDGINASRLTSGSGNVVATYRYGSGAASPPAGRLTTIVQRQPNLAAIHNPAAVTGGKDPQAPADVKTDAPASVFTFGRAISAVDYEVVAAQAAGVTRVRAYWTFDTTAQRTLVKIYVNDDAGGVATATQALAGSDDPNRPVTVAGAQAIEVSVSAILVVAADRMVDDVVAAATAAFTDPVTGAFSPAQMGIGQWLYRSHVDAALSVPGVVAVHQLQVIWTEALQQVADPGEGAYFELPTGNLALTGVPANG